MTQPRLVFVSRKWPPAVGGMETLALRLSEHLAERTEMTSFVLPGREDGKPPVTIALVWFGVTTFFRLVRFRNNTVLHIADMASWPLALAMASRRNQPAIVLSANGTDVTFPRRGTVTGRIYARYLRLGARLLPRAIVIANSRATAVETQRYGYQRTCIVPLATDFQRQHEPLDRTKLLFSGRITPMKGLSWFVSNVLDRLPNEITLDVAGPVWDTTEAACLTHPRVTHIGHLDQSSLARRFAAALAVVIPNVPTPSGQFEGFGLIATEAAAAGGVVLASDHGGLAEAVIDGKTGLTLPAGDAESWISAITRVQRWNDTDRQAFIDSAVETANQVFTWSRVADDTLAAYTRATETGAE